MHSSTGVEPPLQHLGLAPVPGPPGSSGPACCSRGSQQRCGGGGVVEPDHHFGRKRCRHAWTGCLTRRHVQREPRACGLPHSRRCLRSSIIPEWLGGIRVGCIAVALDPRWWHVVCSGQCLLVHSGKRLCRPCSVSLCAWVSGHVCGARHLRGCVGARSLPFPPSGTIANEHLEKKPTSYAARCLTCLKFRWEQHGSQNWSALDWSFGHGPDHCTTHGSNDLHWPSPINPSRPSDVPENAMVNSTCLAFT